MLQFAKPTFKSRTYLFKIFCMIVLNSKLIIPGYFPAHVSFRILLLRQCMCITFCCFKLLFKIPAERFCICASSLLAVSCGSYDIISVIYKWFWFIQLQEFTCFVLIVYSEDNLSYLSFNFSFSFLIKLFWCVLANTVKLCLRKIRSDHIL